ncbi:MAG: metallophosphoesterase family protein [Gemmatimonadales bacterium]|nr:metallophosphoesterase family protein [Gemmatimonadales bacterium]MYG49654.1 metallophosphoesterase family protein [Gemmatimonadales bacterium]MYK00518.1 metallophosphoesterase family protein [Candidatus Palauibacter ramosifaciens]
MSPEPRRIAVFGGVYSNHLALAAAIEDAAARGAEALYCLGDLGAFGPHPDRVFPLLIDHDVRVLRGNYDDSIARGLDDCQCGYTDPRDNYFARLSYRYTFRNTHERWRRWMGRLPGEIRLQVNGTRVLMCHGSPRRMNEFLWESATSTQFLAWLAGEYEADIVLATHTGIPWQRSLPGGGLFANVGVLGRPANDGRPEVWYALLDFGAVTGPPPAIEFVPVAYDHEGLAAEMRDEELPEEFVETILTGWWTTCLEVLPARERARGRS